MAACNILFAICRKTSLPGCPDQVGQSLGISCYSPMRSETNSTNGSNCWFGTPVVWDSNRVPQSNNPFHKGDPRNPNHRDPNQHLTIGWTNIIQQKLTNLQNSWVILISLGTPFAKHPKHVPHEWSDISGHMLVPQGKKPCISSKSC